MKAKLNGGYQTRDKWLCYQTKFRLRKHGMTVDEFGWLRYVWHGNMCGLCEKEFTKTPHIDHAHGCKKSHKYDKGLHKYGCPFCIRGLLCPTCNRFRILGVEFLAEQGLFRHHYLSLRPILTKRYRDASKVSA